MRSRVVALFLNPAELPCLFLGEFTMIHHLARALFIRNQAGIPHAQQPVEAPPAAPAQQPSRQVKPRPITPWRTPTPRMSDSAAETTPLRHVGAPARVRICTDPNDARRTVITGRFAEVCAALDRLVREQEALA
jgi:hypothetical protein